MRPWGERLVPNSSGLSLTATRLQGHGTSVKLCHTIGSVGSTHPYRDNHNAKAGSCAVGRALPDMSGLMDTLQHHRQLAIVSPLTFESIVSRQRRLGAGRACLVCHQTNPSRVSRTTGSPLTPESPSAP